MIKTVPLDLPINFFFGSFFALLCHERIKRDGLKGFSLIVSLSIIYSLWFGGSVAYFYALYPDWMLAYLFDSTLMPAPLFLPFFIGFLGVSGGVGALINQKLLREGMKKTPILITIFSFLFYIVLFLFEMNEYFHVGTFSEYHSGKAISFYAHPQIQKDFTYAAPLTFIPLVILIVFFIRDSMKIRKEQASKERLKP